MPSADVAGHRPTVVAESPAHPVQQLQGPFEESMLESQHGQPDEADVPLDATSRRNLLLEAPTYQRVVAGRWKQKKGEKYHPLWKLVAQMSFGIHLLAENMAKSEEDVFRILQTHVDDIDIFLERTTEDFELAQEDIQERLKCLKLPLQHPDVFDRMLEDRTFRNSIVNGNEKIEHIVTRTGCAMKDALKDVQKGFESTTALERYLHDLQTAWTRTTPEHEALFVAMQGNMEGWKNAFLDLHMQGNKLAGLLRKLTDIINQMQQRAGEVSRRLIRQQQRQGGIGNGSNNITYISQRPTNSGSSSRQQVAASMLTAKKPLPAPTSKLSTRQYSREHSNEYIQAQRTGTSQSQGSGSSQSIRSSSRAETPASRAQSRNQIASMPFRETSQNTTNTSAPRLVYVTNHSAHHIRTPQIVPAHQHCISAQAILEEPDVAERPKAHRRCPEMPESQIRRQEGNTFTVGEGQPKERMIRNLAAVELPAELPPTAFLQAPMSSTNRMSIGLGILPSVRRAQAQSEAFNPTTALIELLNDPSRYSRTPLVPNPAKSSGTARAPVEGQRLPVTQTERQVAQHEPTPGQTPRTTNDQARQSSPAAPKWTSRPIEPTGKSHVMAVKVPFFEGQSARPSADPVKNASVRETSRPPQPMHQSLSYGSLNSSGKITPTSEASVADAVPSELSTGIEHEIPMLLHKNSLEAITATTVLNSQAVKKKKLSFIAELEGSEAVYLPSTVYTLISADKDVPVTFELEAPHMYFTLPPRPVIIDQASITVSEFSANEDEQTSVKARTPFSSGKVTDNPNIKLETVMYEAMRMVGSSSPALERSRQAKFPTSDHQKTPGSLTTKETNSTDAVFEVTHSSRDRLVIATQLPNDPATSDEAVPSQVIIRPTSERPKSPFPMKLNIVTNDDAESKDSSPILKTATTSSSFDSARSNNQASHKKWKAFFGQRKSPTTDPAKSPASPSSLQSASSKQSLRTANLVASSLRSKASREFFIPGAGTNKIEDQRSMNPNLPPLKSGHDEYHQTVPGYGATDHHSIVDDYV